MPRHQGPAARSSPALQFSNSRSRPYRMSAVACRRRAEPFLTLQSGAGQSQLLPVTSETPNPVEISAHGRESRPRRVCSVRLTHEEQEQTMAPAAPLEINPSKVDSVRERELYRYFQPPAHQDNISVHVASSPDTTLTALAQVCALRLHAKRAMIRWALHHPCGTWS